MWHNNYFCVTSSIYFTIQIILSPYHNKIMKGTYRYPMNCMCMMWQYGTIAPNYLQAYFYYFLLGGNYNDKKRAYG